MPRSTPGRARQNCNSIDPNPRMPCDMVPNRRQNGLLPVHQAAAKDPTISQRNVITWAAHVQRGTN